MPIRSCFIWFLVVFFVVVVGVDMFDIGVGCVSGCIVVFKNETTRGNQYLPVTLYRTRLVGLRLSQLFG